MKLSDRREKEKRKWDSRIVMYGLCKSSQKNSGGAERVCGAVGRHSDSPVSDNQTMNTVNSVVSMRD